MKKIIFAAIISLITVLCVSATVANTPEDNFSSSITATIAGVDEGIDVDIRTLVTIYNLLPQKVKDLCVASYKDIALRIDASGSKGFSYAGVSIRLISKDTGDDLKFSCGGHSIVVKNYTRPEFDTIFGI
ncbi:MAG: hypothetical protein J6S16_01545 [Bacteroidales bacterium]|nr:hypothetical protein [Bacteroidales bacterium]MBO7763604.1 hypothetical protein [Bacteroidales bacterium]